MPSLNPWVLLAVVLMLAGVGYEGYNLGSDHEIAKQAKTVQLIAKVREQAQLGAADAIGKIEITQTTINRPLEKTVRENTVYRDCVSDPLGERLLDAARANRAFSPDQTIMPAGPGTGKSP